MSWGATPSDEEGWVSDDSVRDAAVDDTAWLEAPARGLYAWHPVDLERLHCQTLFARGDHSTKWMRPTKVAPRIVFTNIIGESASAFGGAAPPQRQAKRKKHPTVTPPSGAVTATAAPCTPVAIVGPPCVQPPPSPSAVGAAPQSPVAIAAALPSGVAPPAVAPQSPVAAAPSPVVALPSPVLIAASRSPGVAPPPPFNTQPPPSPVAAPPSPVEAPPPSPVAAPPSSVVAAPPSPVVAPPSPFVAPQLVTLPFPNDHVALPPPAPSLGAAPPSPVALPTRAWRLSLWRPLRTRRIASQATPPPLVAGGAGAESASRTSEGQDSQDSLAAPTLVMPGVATSVVAVAEEEASGDADADAEEQIEEEPRPDADAAERAEEDKPLARKKQRRVQHEGADFLSMMPSDLRPPSGEHARTSWTVTNAAIGAKVEVLFAKKALLVKSCPVASFLEGSRRKDGGRQVAWTLMGDLEATWSWLAVEIGWLSE